MELLRRWHSGESREADRVRTNQSCGKAGTPAPAASRTPDGIHQAFFVAVLDTRVLDPGHVRNGEGQTRRVDCNLDSSSTSIEFVAEEEIQMMLAQGTPQDTGRVVEERYKGHPVLLHEEDILSISSSSFTALPSLLISCPPRHLSRFLDHYPYSLCPSYRSR